MARKRNGKRADEPRLDDDSNWVTLTMMHQALSEQLIGARGSVLATMKLIEGLQSDELRSMRKSITDPKRRQLVRAAFWCGHEIYFEDGSVKFHPRYKRRPRPHKTRVLWRYFGWKPDFEKLLAAAKTEEESQRQMGRKRGRKVIKNWRVHCAAELARYVDAGKQLPSAAELAEYLGSEIGYQPEESEINDLIRYLIG